MDRQSSTLKTGSLSRLHTQAKQANLGHRHTPGTQLLGKQQAAQQLIGLLGLGLAGGVGVRGLMGMRDMVKDTQYPPQASAQLPQPINIMRDFPEEEEPEAEGAAMQKAANEPGWAAKTIAPMLPDTHTTNPLKNTWGIPLGVAALGGGAYGGYHLLDWLLKKEKGITGDQQVQEAEDDYRGALAEQYRAAMQAKGAGDDLGIDDLYDTYAANVAEHGREKKAIFNILDRTPLGPPMNTLYPNALNAVPGVNGSGYDIWEGFKGGVDTAALLTALGVGAGTYSWTRGKNKQEILAKALKKRQQQRRGLSPAPVVALPEEETADAA